MQAVIMTACIAAQIKQPHLVLLVNVGRRPLGFWLYLHPLIFSVILPVLFANLAKNTSYSCGNTMAELVFSILNDNRLGHRMVLQSYYHCFQWKSHDGIDCKVVRRCTHGDRFCLQMRLCQTVDDGERLGTNQPLNTYYQPKMYSLKWTTNQSSSIHTAGLA